MERTELYRWEMLIPAKGKRKRALIAMLIIGVLGLSACILFCVFATRRNMRVMLPLTIGTSILSGWTVITILHGAFSESNAEQRHCRLMLEEPRVKQIGRFEKTDDVRRVRNGVTMRKIRMTEDGHERMLSVNEALAGKLPDAFSGTVETVYDFIVAYEVNGDD